ncbi:hypothetical protein QR685DRAFT_168562 [Neurospora intermedia]|uniref:Uncharacterized protein n=1 Tax=Neurospora intermedia TaxID=5142 RepID=A0ABR3DKR8_NEUIN
MTLVVNTDAKAHSLSQDRTSTSAGFNQPEGNTDLQYPVEEDEPYDFALLRHKLIVCCGLPYVNSHSKRVS